MGLLWFIPKNYEIVFTLDSTYFSYWFELYGRGRSLFAGAGAGTDIGPLTNYLGCIYGDLTTPGLTLLDWGLRILKIWYLCG